MVLPLALLAALSIIGGFINLPQTLGNAEIFSRFMHSALPALVAVKTTLQEQYMLLSISSVVSLVGLYFAYVFYLRSPQLANRIIQHKLGLTVHKFWFSDWGFDWLYDKLFVQPYVWFADFDKDDFIDSIFDGIAGFNAQVHCILSATQNGKVRWYVVCIAIGAVLILGIAIFI